MSNVQVQLRRGTTAQHAVYTGPQGEVTVDTDKNALVLHDGATAGGKVMPTGDVVATGSTTARSLEDRFADRICVFDYMSDAEITAVRNRDYSSITDVTTSVQAALDDPDVKKLYFPEGLYYCDNLTIPNKTLDILGAGQEITDIFAITGLTDTNYFVASSNYVSNNTSAGNSPLKVSGLNFNGSGVADNTFVLYGYFSVLQDSSFKDSASGGFSLVISDTTKDGTICSSTLVENKINNCIIRGAGGGGAFRVTAGQKVTDGRLSNCIVFDGRTLCQTLAGWNISNNHFYGSGAVFFSRASQGTVIHGNYFESSVNMEDFIEGVVQMSSNAHTSTLTASFGTSGFKLIVDNPYFTGAGIVSHDFFSDSREIIINGGSFGTGVSTFTNWTNGSSTGKIKLNRVYAYADGLLLSGVGNALTNDYSEDFLSNTANTSSSFTPLTWQTTSSGGPTANYTWVKRIGRYIKVGKQVTVWFYHEWTSANLGTGLSEVGILPEASANVTDLEFSGVISKISSTATADQFTLHIPPNSTALRVKKKISGSATTDLDRSDWTIGTNYIAGQITYLID